MSYTLSINSQKHAQQTTEIILDFYYYFKYFNEICAIYRLLNFSIKNPIKKFGFSL